jgi:hypothetical protein
VEHALSLQKPNAEFKHCQYRNSPLESVLNSFHASQSSCPDGSEGYCRPERDAVQSGTWLQTLQRSVTYLVLSTSQTHSLSQFYTVLSLRCCSWSLPGHSCIFLDCACGLHVQYISESSFDCYNPDISSQSQTQSLCSNFACVSSTSVQRNISQKVALRETAPSAHVQDHFPYEVDFFQIYLIFPAALWPLGRLSL